MSLKEIYTLVIRVLGAWGGLVFILESLGVATATLGPLDFIVTGLSFWIGYELGKERKLTAVDRVFMLAPYVFLCKHVTAVVFGATLFSGVLNIFLTVVTCVAIYGFFGTFEGKKDEPKAKNTELGEYPIYLTPEHVITTEQTFEHVQIIGKSGSGKTASYFMNTAWQITQYGLGMFILDPKSEEINRLTYYAKEAGRQSDYHTFDLMRPERSPRMNPLYKFSVDHNGMSVPNSKEAANVAFGAMYYGEAETSGDSSFFIKMAKSFIDNFTALFHKEFPVITFFDMYHVVAAEMETFKSIEALCDKHPEGIEADYFRGQWLNLPVTERKKILSGLLNKLSLFVTGPWAPLLNSRNPQLTMAQVVNEGKIFHLGSAALVYPFDYKNITVALLYDLMGEIGKLGSQDQAQKKPFHLLLDEFSNVTYPGFVDIINKVRSKGIPCHIGHQSMGDLASVSESFESRIIDSTTTKICFRVLNDVTARKFADMIGHKEAKIKMVKSFKTNAGIFGENQEAGESQSGVGTQEWIFNPQEFKVLNKGEAIANITYRGSVTAFKIQFEEAPKPPNDHDFNDVAPVLNNHLKPMEKSLPFADQEVVAVKEVEKPVATNPPEPTTVFDVKTPEEVKPAFAKDKVFQDMKAVKKMLTDSRRPRKVTPAMDKKEEEGNGP